VAGFLPPIWVRLFGVMMPWWILPGVYAVGLTCFALPRLVNYSPMREFALALVVAVPLTLVGGIAALAWWDHRATIGTEWTDDELVAQLGAEHPAIAEHAAWTVMRRNGPRAAAPALEKLLQSPSVDARRAAAVALTRVGPLALASLDSVEAALADGRNEEIEETLRKTRDHLRSYLWARQQVESYRYQLLHDEDDQSRGGAAFSLGQLGEMAVVALPDLEIAARDPRNQNFAHQVESVIEKLRRHEQLKEPEDR